jgi:hypothetical protein
LIRAKSAITFEIDDPKAALEDIKEQLSVFAPLQNSAAVIQYDAEATEAARVIAAELPYPAIGGVTVSQTVNAGSGSMCVSVIVLTSDDTEFICGHTSGLEDDIQGATETAYQEAAAKTALPVKMVLVIPPIIEKYAGDAYIEAFSSICEKIPIFGSFFIGEDMFAYDTLTTIHNGETFAAEMQFLIVAGAAEPRFFVANISDKRVLPVSGVVTKVDSNVIKEIDGAPPIRFLERAGLAENGAPREGFVFIPYLFRADHGDGRYGASFARGVTEFTENGDFVLRGAMYENSMINVGSIHGPEVLEGTLAAIDEINVLEGANAAIMFSCIMRRVVSGATPLAEAESVMKRVRPDLPFIMASSGGEICPVNKPGEEVENRFHNYSFIVCAL